LIDRLKECEKCLAIFEIDWIVSGDTVVHPDIIVICEEPEGEYITKAPVIIFEIVSKNTAQKDEIVKYEIYQKEGVKFYILVYPDLKVARVYKQKDGRFVKLKDVTKERIDFELEKCNISFDFSLIWESSTPTKGRGLSM